MNHLCRLCPVRSHCVPQECVFHQPFLTKLLVLVSPRENISALYREIWLLRPLKKVTSNEDAVLTSLMQADWLWFIPIFTSAEKVGVDCGASLSVYQQILFGSKLCDLSQYSLPDDSSFCTSTCFLCCNLFPLQGCVWHLSSKCVEERSLVDVKGMAVVKMCHPFCCIRWKEPLSLISSFSEDFL